MNRLKLLELTAIAYLALPLVIFSASFLIWPLAIVCTGAAMFVLWRAGCETDIALQLSPALAVLLPVAVLWAIASGTTTLFGQSSDWYKHYAVLNSLRDNFWPPQNGDGLYLRYGLGYYIVPALVSKFMSLPVAVAIWTILGIWIALGLLLDGARGAASAGVLSLVFVFFSGWDLVGSIWLQRSPMLPWHFEWWLPNGQISAISKSLEWATQHAIAALLSVGLLLRFRERAVQFDGLVLAAVVFWSPLTAVGMLPFWAARWWESAPRMVFAITNLAIYPMIVTLALYLTSGSAGIVRHWIWRDPSFSFKNFLLFHALEWGLIVVALLISGYRSHRGLLAIAIGTCLAMSLYRYGEAYDLLMRASAPAIIVIATFVTQALSELPAARTAPLMVVLAIGASTPIAELSRPFISPRVPDPSSVSFGDAVPPHLISQYFSSRPAVIRRRSSPQNSVELPVPQSD